MRIVLQRVRQATVQIRGKTTASIDRGLLLLVGIGTEDAADHFPKIARKIADLRVFEDREGKMNRSLKDIHGEILAVSQFTLYGETKKGRRPSFTHAAPPKEAKTLFEAFIAALTAEGIPTKTGRFGAKMQVHLINDGPVTVILNLAPFGVSG